ncbi:HU family DNA-binding protein [Elusimicrobiota bacterium]
MNRKDLIERLSLVFMTKKEAKNAVREIFVSIREALRKGDKVIISELGTFRPYIAKAKKGHNPNNGQTIQIPPKKKVRFHQSKSLFEK